jgi:hypothetical protein
MPKRLTDDTETGEKEYCRQQKREPEEYEAGNSPLAR